MSVDTDTNNTQLVPGMLDARLVARASVLVIAYMISLIVLITAIIAGYLVLRKEMVTQRALSEARTHINALHHSTNDSVSLMIDYRRATRGGNPNSRLAQVIEKRIKDATKVIDERGIMLRSTMLRLEGTTYWDKFEWIKTLVQDEPSTLLDRFTGQMHALVTRRDDLGVRAVRPLIPAEAAGARYGALSTNFRQASDQLAAMIDKHSIRLETVHKQLTTLIVFMLLLVSSLIVLPLWRRLIREHKRHEQAHKQLFEFAYIDQETGLPNLDGLELECLTKSVSPETGSEHYLLLIRIRNLDEIYNLIGSQQVLDLHQIISERLHTTSINLQSWSRSSESEYSTVISKQSVDCSKLWMERLFVELVNPVRVAGILVRPVINMAISQLRGVEYGRSGMLREHQANARMALPFFDRNTLDLPAYEVRFKQELASQNELITAITNGIEKEEFVPFYQLKMESATGKPCAMEVLCRWQTSDGGFMRPDQFIPAAEKSGQIVPMTYQLLETVVSDVQKWSLLGLATGPVAVNVSVDVLQHRDFVAKFSQARDLLLAAGSNLDIEITENVAIDNSSGITRQILGQLSDLEITIAIDDFGTGYASLQTLIDLPFDVLKIDRSFLLHMSEDGQGSEVVSAMISLCSKLEKRSVVEGVEHKWQWQHLARMGADELQGFYFHKPACVDDVSDWLHSHNHWRKAS